MFEFQVVTLGLSFPSIEMMSKPYSDLLMVWVVPG